MNEQDREQQGQSDAGADHWPGRRTMPRVQLQKDQAGRAKNQTGDGEEIARLTLAARTMRNLERQPPDLAVEAAISQLARVKGEAGGIAVDSHGRIGWAHNSPAFVVAIASGDAPAPKAFLSKEEEQRG